MLKYAGLFIEHLQKMNVNFSVDSGVDERGNETITRVKIPCGETNITASFFGDENGTLFCASMAVGVINPNCIKLVSEDVIALCNEFNSNNQWVKFCVRDGNSVPGLNGALICLEEAAVLVEKTAAQNAYSIVSNLIKAHAESKGSFARLLNGSPAEKADNEPLTKFYIGHTQVSKKEICEIEYLLKQKEKIKAINLVKDLTGLGLAEAKAFIDNYSSYNLNAPQQIFAKEKPKNNTDKKQNNNLNVWFPVILAAVGIFGGAVLSVQFQVLIYVFLGCILGGCGLGVMYKQKVKRQDEFLRQGQVDWRLVLEQRKKEKLPTVLTWILFVLGMINFWMFCSIFNS